VDTDPEERRRAEDRARAWAERRERWRKVIFEHDTAAGWRFDVALIVAIIASVIVVSVESMPTLAPDTRLTLRILEWFFTILFTLDYAARLWTSPRPTEYARSFYGIVDLLATLPTYLSIFFPGGRFLALIRILRVMRVFRVLKLTTYVREAGVLGSALRASRQKITVFLFTVVVAVVVVGSLMFLIEGEDAGFTSIPASMYWAIVTLTTVGYGDIAPVTPMGRMLASALMVLGYGIIAVPTGIVTVELQKAARGPVRLDACVQCGLRGHDGDARHCKRCGAALAGA
jgi:voltage-gated potassium channel